MRWLERIENRLHWIAFPGIFKWITLLGAIVFASQLADPGIASAVAFDRAAILDGEWWRIATFIFDPGIGFSPFGALFFFFAVMIAFLIDNSLEAVWSTTRITLYVLVCWVSLGVALWFLPVPEGGAGRYLFTSMFFAFATHFPRHEFLMFFILPLQVRFLAWVALGLLVFSGLTFPPAFLLLLAVTFPYALWVLPAYLGNRKTLIEAGVRRRKFERQAAPEDDAFHRCDQCGRTELTDPELDFRTMTDGTEYCIDHLPEDPASS